ncbi:MAG: hypothetical protein R2855_04720 [Thermomicrobiales bacterium]
MAKKWRSQGHRYLCAVTGAVHVPSQSPHLRSRPADRRIGDRRPRSGRGDRPSTAPGTRTGKPTPEPDQYLAFVPEIKEHCNAIINITTGGRVRA